MSKLNWISDNNLEVAVDHILTKAKEANSKSDKEFGKNVIDPFSAIFEMSGFKLDFHTWLKSEKTRQSQKTLQNHIGDFHQKILGSVDKWQNMKTGNIIDLVSQEDKIIAEIKNKYNTISGGKLADLYNSLNGLIMPKSSIYKGYTAYYVAIIPKSRKRFNREFTPSDKEIGEKCQSNNNIREIDGASFYDLVTNEKNALLQLYNALHSIIEKCSSGQLKVDNIDNLTSFFNLAFESID